MSEWVAMPTDMLKPLLPLRVCVNQYAVLVVLWGHGVLCQMQPNVYYQTL